MEFRVEIGEIREIQSVTTLTSVIVTLTLTRDKGRERVETQFVPREHLNCRPELVTSQSQVLPWASSKLKPSCVVFV